MEDEDKIYWLKIVLGIAFGVLSVVLFPQALVEQGVHVGWYRFLWLLGTWLLLPILLVVIGLRLGWLGVPQKEKNRRDNKMKKTESSMSSSNPVHGEKFVLKDALKKLGGPKFIIKTGVGAFFFLFLLTSTIIYTLLYPGL